MYYIVSEPLTFVANEQTYTMGTGGDLNTTRPTKIEDSCYITYAGIDIPLRLINELAWANITVKSLTSNLPMYLFADMQNPLVRLNFYPKPTTSAASAQIKSWKQLQQFSSLSDTLALPPGYERAITFSLAEEYGPEYGAVITPQVMQIASKARAAVKRVNAQAPIANSEVGYMSRDRTTGWNIYTGP